MANWCFNSLTITSAVEDVQPLLQMLTESRTTEPTAEYGDYWYRAFIAWMKQNGKRPNAQLGACETEFEYEKSDGDGTASLNVQWSSRWTFDEGFIRCLGSKMGLDRVEFSAEEVSESLFYEAEWHRDKLVNRREALNGWWSDEVGYVIQWDSNEWTVDGEQSTAAEALSLLAKDEDEDLRLCAAEHDETPLSVIISLIGDEYEEAADAARDALCRFTNEELASACGVPGVDLSDVPTDWLVETIKAMS